MNKNVLLVVIIKYYKWSPRGSKDHQQMGYSWVHMMVEYIAISAFTNGHLGCHISVQYRACYHFVKAGLKPKMSDFRHDCGRSVG